MKKFVSLFFVTLMTLGLQSQIPMLDEILQEKFEQETFDLTMDFDEVQQENTEENYYKFIERDFGNDTLLGYKWNRQTEEWILRARIVKVYNDAEQVTEKYFQVLKDDGTWKEGLRYSYTFTDDGDPLGLLIQHWAEDAGDWVNHFKRVHHYNDGGKLAAIKTQWWSRWHEEWVDHHLKRFAWNGDLLVADTVKMKIPMFDGWINHHYNKYNYSDAGLKINKVQFHWSHYLGIWKKVKKMNFNYADGGENVISVLVQHWFGEDAGWKDIHQHNYSYNDGDDVSHYLFEIWNHYLQIWVGKMQVDYTYNDQGWMSNFVIQHKHYADQNWMNVKQASFSYDDGGNMIERVSQNWDKQAEEWVNYRKWEMVLQYKTATGLYETNENLIRAIFKNPYNPGNQIKFEGLEKGIYQVHLYDISGKIMETKQIDQSGLTGFNVSLHNGLYIMVLSGKSGTLFNTKLVVSQ